MDKRLLPFIKSFIDEHGPKFTSIEYLGEFLCEAIERKFQFIEPKNEEKLGDEVGDERVPKKRGRPKRIFTVDSEPIPSNIHSGSCTVVEAMKILGLTDRRKFDKIFLSGVIKKVGKIELCS